MKFNKVCIGKRYIETILDCFKYHLKIFCVVICFLIVTFFELANADTITLAAPDFFCPYACKANSKFEGFTVDLAKASLALSGHKVEYKNFNYDRTLDLVRKGAVNATPTAFKGEAVGFVFPEEASSLQQLCCFGKVGEKSDKILVPKEIPADWKNIGIVSGYSFGPEFDLLTKTQPKKFVKVSGDNALLRLSKMLTKGRISVFIEEKSTVHWQIKEGLLDSASMKGCLPVTKDNYTYLAFSPSNPKSIQYAAEFSKGLKRLRETGQMKSILEKYELHDWKAAVVAPQKTNSAK